MEQQIFIQDSSSADNAGRNLGLAASLSKAPNLNRDIVRIERKTLPDGRRGWLVIYNG